MLTSHGAFVWHELLTTDFEAAKAFYAKVIGWDGCDPGMGMPYWMFITGQKPVAGMMTIPPDVLQMGAPPHWEGYVGVEDVDATVEKVKQLGGTVHKEPENIPGVGRFAVVADPQNVVIALFKWESSMSGETPQPMSPGTVGWNELYAPDAQKAFEFYAAVFGWTKGDAMDMGPMGTYQLFRHNGRDIGGMMNKPPQMPFGSWVYYFCVTDIDAAVERLNSAGGKVVMGPMQVPGGGWIVQATDPQGAFFALLGMRPTA
jgi:predicted enzyme related to lactoylglutathione lyase